MGLVKENEREVKEALDVWIESRWEASGGRRPADWVEVEKGHGRLERREIWVEPAEELGEYLEREWGWVGLTCCGRVRRWRCRLDGSMEEVEEHTWAASVPAELATPRRILGWLRGHWSVENRVFRVRDVSYQEDRLHGRKIGLALAHLRDGAINVIRGLHHRYMVDAWRELSASPHLMVHILSSNLLEL